MCCSINLVLGEYDPYARVTLEQLIKMPLPQNSWIESYRVHKTIKQLKHHMYAVSKGKADLLLKTVANLYSL